MMRRSVQLLTLLVFVLGTGPVLGQAGDKAPADPVVLLKELLLQVTKLQDSITDLKKRLDDTPTEQSIDSQIRKALAGQAVELDALRKQVDQLQRDVATLRGVTPRVSAYAPGIGRISLVNLYPAPMTVIVNERSYRLAAAGQPGDRQMLDNLQAGQFTYQVLGVQQELLSRVLTPNETFTITVYPR